MTCFYEKRAEERRTWFSAARLLINAAHVQLDVSLVELRQSCLSGAYFAGPRNVSAALRCEAPRILGRFELTRDRDREGDDTLRAWAPAQSIRKHPTTCQAGSSHTASPYNPPRTSSYDKQARETHTRVRR